MTPHELDELTDGERDATLRHAFEWLASGEACSTDQLAECEAIATRYAMALLTSQKEIERLRSRLTDLRASCLANYMGGHHEPLQLEAFRHGMATVCNVVDSIIKETP